MAKYKLTVKYSDVCELSIAGDIPDIIGNEFDNYLKSMLYKKEQWENFETSFKETANLEYGRLSQTETDEDKTPESDKTSAVKELQTDESHSKSCVEEKEETQVQEISPRETPVQESLEAPQTPSTVPFQKKSETMTLTFADYIKNKNINTPLDEFVVGACYLNEILDIKEFTLKQLNSKLYPAFGHLADLDTIEHAIKRVLIEVIKEDGNTKYTINQNAWNYHNYDLVRR